MHRVFLIGLFVLYNHSASAWEVWMEQDPNYSNAAIAEVVGEEYVRYS